MVPYAYLIGKMYAMGGEKRVKRLDFVSKKRDFEEWESCFFVKAFPIEYNIMERAVAEIG